MSSGLAECALSVSVGELGGDCIRDACALLLDDGVEALEKVAFLRGLQERGVTHGELIEFAMAFLCGVESPLDSGDGLIDVCGTGGDGGDTFNISTAAMFVAAAAGATVAKYGNRAITSKCGGADVLEALGVRIDLPSVRVGDSLAGVGCCFLFAPQYLPAFGAVRAARDILAKEGVPTVFNLLGPLLNPVRPEFQSVGVSNRFTKPAQS